MACNAEQRHLPQGWRPESASAHPRWIAVFPRLVTASSAHGAATVGHLSGVDAASRLSH